MAFRYKKHIRKKSLPSGIKHFSYYQFRLMASNTAVATTPESASAVGNK
jgi:hypothetical protein